MNLFDNVKNKVSNLFKNKNSFTVKGRKYYEEKLLGEGGFGYVYQVQSEEGREYALKFMHIQDARQSSNIKRELATWSSINNHPNIIKLIDFEITNKSATILMELCKEGSLFNYINDHIDTQIHESQALRIFSDVLQAVLHMHSAEPPIAHRDIKIENVLKFGERFKLCDFGSASSEVLNPSTASRDAVREQFAIYDRTTTFMYRPPEMVDEYCKYIVNDRVDTWMLGCLLYTVLHKKHPFFDAQKTTIINAYYHFPDGNPYSEKLDDFIRWMLTQNPRDRPSCAEVLSVLKKWQSVKRIDLPKETLELKTKQLQHGVKKADGLLSEDKIRELQLKIMKDQEKKNKRFRKPKEDDEDIDHIFEDIDDIYPVAKKPQDGNHPKEEKYAKGESYGKSPSKENKDRLESRITNDNKSASVWDIDFNQAFDETRRKEPKTGISANLDFAVQFDNFDFFAQPGQEKSKDIRQGKFQGQDQGTSSTDPFAAFQNNFGAIENRDDNSKGFIGDNCNRKIQGNSGSNDMKGQVRGEHGNSKENNDLGRDKKEQNVFDFFA